MPRIYGVAAVFMTAIGISIARSGNTTGPGLVVCRVAAVVLAFFAYVLGRVRLTCFTRLWLN